VACGAVLVALLVAWAGGAFKVKTKGGTLVLENVPADAEVLVDGDRVTVTRNGDEITVQTIQGGTYPLKVVRKNGDVLLSRDVQVTVGGELIRLRVEANPPGQAGRPTPAATPLPPPSPALEPAPAATPDKPAPPAVTPPAAAVRNPFGLKDVFDVEGEDVKAFSAKVKVRLISGQNEPNAPQWARLPVPGVRGKLEGGWASRWRSGLENPWETGTAAVREVSGRVFVLYYNPNPAYLIEAVREGKTRLVGRYVNLKSPLRDNSPWVGEIIDDERIDGKWTGGRWDLRRQLR